MHLYSSEEQNRPAIVLTDDVIEEWQKRTGKPIELLEDMYMWHTKYIKHLTETKEDAVQIKLPKIGRLYFNPSLAASSKISKKNKEIEEIIEKRIQTLIYQKVRTLHNNIPMVRRVYEKYVGKRAARVGAYLHRYWRIVEQYNDEKVNKKD